MGLCLRTEMWCYYSDTSRGGWSLCVLRQAPCISLLWPSPPPHSIFFLLSFIETRDYRRQPQCNCSLRYAGRTRRPFPRASPAKTEWHWHQSRLQSGECWQFRSQLTKKNALVDRIQYILWCWITYSVFIWIPFPHIGNKVKQIHSHYKRRFYILFDQNLDPTWRVKSSTHYTASEHLIYWFIDIDFIYWLYCWLDFLFEGVLQSWKIN